MRVGIVADDLTGAMDSAAPFADRGFATRVLFGADAARASHGSGPASVLAIDTHTRDLAAAAAAEAVHAGTAAVCAPGTLPFKKIDSTLRGNIGSEIAAAMRAGGRRVALVAPAAPSQGRVVRDDRLFVHGERTGDSRVTDLLRAALPGMPVGRLESVDAQSLGDESCIYVADAGADSDLDRIAALGLGRRDDLLLVGSSGLAAALARQLGADAAPATAHRRTFERLWFVVGSYNARSAEQVRALARQEGVARLVLTPSGEVQSLGAGRLGARVGVLHVESLDAPPTLDPAQVAGRLAAVAAPLLAEIGAASTALFLTGGDTARAVLSRLGIGSIEVVGTLYPGVVRGEASLGGERLSVITKAGGFGNVDLFPRVAQDLLQR
jgi:uncharacterized protein YgbK (DUF1537 family)